MARNCKSEDVKDLVTPNTVVCIRPEGIPQPGSLRMVIPYSQCIVQRVDEKSLQGEFWEYCRATYSSQTDPRMKLDPEELLRTLTGNLQSTDDLASALESMFPLHAVPDHLKDQAETDINVALDGAMVPVSDPLLPCLGISC